MRRGFRRTQHQAPAPAYSPSSSWAWGGTKPPVTVLCLNGTIVTCAQRDRLAFGPRVIDVLPFSAWANSAWANGQ